jgi:RNA polymerase sigma factor (sigma-70 family)
MGNKELSPVVRHIRRLAGVPHEVGVTDRHLLDRYLKQRDIAALEVIVSRYAPLVLGLCRKILGNSPEADDAFQATFLVLFRKAGSIRRQDTLAPWLYGVAYRVAARARAIRSKQRVREKPLGERDWASTTGDPLLSEVGALIHEEINRLPDKYRKLVVLCYLMGKKREEAAQLLGWSQTTVKGRLERARTRLRRRLVRRGIEPTTVALTAALDLAAPAVPSDLIDATVRAALSVAARGMAASAVSGTVASLAEGVLRSMIFAKVRVIALVLLVLGTVSAGGAAWGFRLRAEEPPKISDNDTQAQIEQTPKVVARDDDEAEHIAEVPSLHNSILLYLGAGPNQRLRKGDKVQVGQVLAKLDDRLARADLLIKEAKVLAAKADLEATRKTAAEAEKRYQTQLRLRKAAQTAEEDVGSAKLTMERYVQEAVSKEQAVRVAELELEQAKIIMDTYTVTSRVKGVITKIYKRPGEAVKAFEPIMQIRVEE